MYENLEQLSLRLSASYEDEDLEWRDSPFAWIKSRPSRQRGKIAEELVAGLCDIEGLRVARSPDSDADLLVEGVRVEVKSSTLGRTAGTSSSSYAIRTTRSPSALDSALQAPTVGPYRRMCCYRIGMLAAQASARSMVEALESTQPGSIWIPSNPHRGCNHTADRSKREWPSFIHSWTFDCTNVRHKTSKVGAQLVSC